MKKIPGPTTPEHSAAPQMASSTPSASTPRADAAAGSPTGTQPEAVRRVASGSRPEAAKSTRPEAVKSVPAKSAPAKSAARPVAKATPRVGVTQAHFTPPADAPEPAAPATITPVVAISEPEIAIIPPVPKAKRAAKAAAPAPADVSTPPAKKAVKKAAPAKRATKAPAKPVDDLIVAAEPEPKPDVVEIEATPPIIAPADSPIAAEISAEIVAETPAQVVTETPAEVTVPKQDKSPVPKVFVGDVLAANSGATVGRTREDLPSDTALARAAKAQPLLASAALALASVARFGESAREQAEWLRSVYPKVGPERLARVALDSARKRTRYAVGATLLGGPLGVAASVSTLAVAKARLIIDIAAIFGADPLDPERAVDVLVLLGAYPDAPAAAKAVSELVGDGISEPAAALADDVTTPRPTLMAAATAQLLTKAVGRLIPGMGALASALRSTSETEQLTDRTIRYFKG